MEKFDIKNVLKLTELSSQLESGGVRCDHIRQVGRSHLSME